MKFVEPIGLNRKFGAMGHPSRGAERYRTLGFKREMGTADFSHHLHLGGRANPSVYSSSIWRSKGAACMQSSCAIFFRAAFRAELGQASTVTTKGRRSFG
jgi:hypothetical protein